jgi:hypothetical protein
MDNFEHSFAREINLNCVKIADDPARVCYVINQKTKDRLAKHVKSSTVLTASIMVDLALNLLLKELESGGARLVVNLDNDEE